jgi:hypothetical protein
MLNKLFERTIPLELFKSIYDKKEITIVHDYSDDDRNEYIFKQLNYTHNIALEYNMQPTSSSTTNSNIKDNLKIYLDNNENVILDTLDNNNLNTLNKLITGFGENILIDITGINVRLLAIILSALKNYLQVNTSEKCNIYCGYTDSDEYRRNSLKEIFGDSYNQSSDINVTKGNKKFDFYNAFAGVQDIPFLTSIGSDDVERQTWIVLLGFEGERPNRIQSELSKVDNVIALVTIPPMRPGWSNYAFEENSHFLEGIAGTSPEIQYISALSPYSVYNYLCDFQRDSPDNRILLSPLGTKATSLGAILFALNYQTSAFIFDNPYEGSNKEISKYGNSYIYDVTEALKFDPEV